MDHVAAILNNQVRLECSSAALKKRLEPLITEHDDETDVCITFSSKAELAKILTELQGLALPFGSEPDGWAPADVFKQLREEGLVQGTIKTLAWRGRGEPVYGEM